MKMIFKVLMVFLGLRLAVQTAYAYPPAPATQASVNTGLEPYLYVTPATLKGVTQNLPIPDLSGSIAVNANPTVIGGPVGFAPPNTNYGGHGEVMVIGTGFGSGDANPALAFDGNFATADTSGGSPAYLGFVSTSTFQQTRWRTASDATAESGGFFDEQLMNGVGYGTCTDTSFDGKVPLGATPISFTEPTLYFNPRYQFTEYTNGLPSAATKWVYLGFTNSYLAIAEGQVIGINTLNAAPVAPMIAPWGGHYTNGTVTVTLASISTAGSNYYTVDGTLPTGPGHGTLYTGPFTLNCISANTITNPTILMAVTYDAGLVQPCSMVSSNALFYSTGFVPLDTYRDQNGNICELHTISYLDDTVNGQDRHLIYGDDWNVANSGALLAFGVGELLYETPDFLNYIYLGQVSGIDARAKYQYRANYAFNPQYHNYVEWNELATGSGVYAYGVSTSPSPTGPFTYIYTNCLPFGSTVYGDMKLFPFNGNCYLIGNSNGQNGGVWISKLNPTWTTNVGSFVNICVPYGESPVMTYIPGVGFNCTVQMKGNFYDATLAMSETNYLCPGTNPLGTYYSSANSQNLFPADPVNTVGALPVNLYNSQVDAVIPSPWNTNQNTTFGDHAYNGATAWWNPLIAAYSTTPTINPADGTLGTLYNSRLVILPLSISNTNVIAVTNANWWLPEWYKPTSIISSVTLGTITPAGGAGYFWTSNNAGPLYWVDTVKNTTNLLAP